MVSLDVFEKSDKNVDAEEKRSAGAENVDDECVEIKIVANDGAAEFGGAAPEEEKKMSSDEDSGGADNSDFDVIIVGAGEEFAC